MPPLSPTLSRPFFLLSGAALDTRRRSPEPLIPTRLSRLPRAMDPLDAVVREAVLQLFAAAAAAPNAAAFPPAAWDAFGVAEAAAPPLFLENARSALVEALFAADSAGLDPSLVAAAASSAGAAYHMPPLASGIAWPPPSSTTTTPGREGRWCCYLCPTTSSSTSSAGCTATSECFKGES